ncbi:MAG: NAD(P)H-dependent oxidoreductase [Christensenellaceae bacterium]|nr:NAD(P)H-dependent oxidoreductase [Christensenellaceae bacterium]
MKLLYVDACVRGEASRTKRLASVFLEECGRLMPGLSVITQRLGDMSLRPIDADTLAMKEALCDRRAWDDPFLQPAVDFQSADAVVVAAPYWDLSFPSQLKVWVENVYVRNLTFRYENDRCIGLCRGKESVYLTTAGSPIGDHDWGTGYMKAVLTTLGIPGFTAVKAEALDLEGRDVEAIMAEAEQRALQAARELALRLTGGASL